MKSIDKGVPTPKVPQGKMSTTVNRTSGISFGQTRAKQYGINPAVPKK